ncbi:cohesin domain-containing protein [Domibacillus mangrovi]|uniref:SbsA Ig-like domain-containing protein n=1 Tax=Domibacillus mangrovi TaxID=1714354 RepID=A0A1Q5P663_9BACI|nr:cohesin domain-containing protein [Domibacillus mangrovi]OKL37641.1 hypothetical protein BLL40_04900 [Domibacillus mangrovi]
MNFVKYRKLLLLFFAFVFLLPNPIVKAEGKSFVGATTIYEGQKGKTLKISLYIHGSEKIAGGSLDLLYDKTALTVQKTEAGDQLTGYLSSVHTGQDGKVSLVWAKAVGETQEGTLLTITARLLKADETTNLDLQNVKIYSKNGSAIAVDSFDGSVKPFKGDVRKHKSKVKGDKEWSVRLNNEFNSATVNKHTVTVKDSGGNAIDVKIKVRDSKVFVVSPKSNYSRGTYTLEITEQVRSLKGSKLKQPIKYEFSVE